MSPHPLISFINSESEARQRMAKRGLADTFDLAPIVYTHLYSLGVKHENILANHPSAVGMVDEIGTVRAELKAIGLPSSENEIGF